MEAGGVDTGHYTPRQADRLGARVAERDRFVERAVPEPERVREAGGLEVQRAGNVGATQVEATGMDPERVGLGQQLAEERGRQFGTPEVDLLAFLCGGQES